MRMDAAMQQLAVCGQMISKNVNRIDVLQLWKQNWVEFTVLEQRAHGLW